MGRTLRRSVVALLVTVVVMWLLGWLVSWGPWVGLGCVAVLLVDTVVTDRRDRRAFEREREQGSRR